MKIGVHLLTASGPIEYESVGTYVKEGFYCIILEEKDGVHRVVKYPVNHIYKVDEDY